MRIANLRPLLRVLSVAGGALALAAGCGDDIRRDRSVSRTAAPVPSAPAEPESRAGGAEPLSRAKEATPKVPALAPVSPPDAKATPGAPRSSAEIPASFEERMQAGQKLVRAGRADEAIALFEAALEARPKSARPHVEIARIHLARGDLAGARAHAEKAVELAPRHSAAWNTLGRVSLAEGDLAAAESSFERAVEENEDNAYAWNNLGLVRMRAGRFEEAVEPLENATAGPRTEPFMWNNLGMAYEHLDRLVEARAAYRRASEAGSQAAARNLARLEGVESIRTAKAPAAVEDVVPPDAGLAH